MDADVATFAAMKVSAAAAASSTSSKLTSRSVPPPPQFPKYLAPTHANFSGYKLQPAPLPCQRISLAAPLCTIDRAPSAPAVGSNAAPSSFHAISQKLKSNQLAILRSEDPRDGGAHAVYYIDHKAVWQLDPPSAATVAAASATSAEDAADAASSASQGGGSHIVYAFDSLEDGDGLSFMGVSPCLLLLTRGGGRLTILLVNPHAGHELSRSGSDGAPVTELFDGSPLSPAPLMPHHATLSAALLSEKRDKLFVVLYEFWHEQTDRERKAAAISHRKEGIAFVHEVRTYTALNEKTLQLCFAKRLAHFVGSLVVVSVSPMLCAPLARCSRLLPPQVSLRSPLRSTRCTSSVPFNSTFAMCRLWASVLLRAMPSRKEHPRWI